MKIQEIETELQYEIALKQLTLFEEAIAKAEANPAKDVEEVLRAAHLAGMRSVARDLEIEIRKYENKDWPLHLC